LNVAPSTFSSLDEEAICGEFRAAQSDFGNGVSENSDKIAARRAARAAGPRPGHRDCRRRADFDTPEFHSRKPGPSRAMREGQKKYTTLGRLACDQG